MVEWGKAFADKLHGGEVIELIGDVGAGKTTLTKALATGLGITEAVQSPTFTISRQYAVPDGRRLVHYDFYRLSDAGIMSDELYEALQDPHTITVIEWADVVAGVLPEGRTTIRLQATGETTRELTLKEAA